MTTPKEPSDDRLLDFLKDALDSDADVTEATIDMLMAGYDIVHTDALEAETVFDSFAGAAVRSSESDVRHLRFESDAVVFALELDPVATRCAGRVEPPGGSLEVERLGGSTSIDLAESGSFDVTVEGSGPLRLRYVLDTKEVVTPWFRMTGPELGLSQ